MKKSDLNSKLLETLANVYYQTTSEDEKQKCIIIFWQHIDRERIDEIFFEILHRYAVLRVSESPHYLGTLFSVFIPISLTIFFSFISPSLWLSLLFGIVSTIGIYETVYCWKKIKLFENIINFIEERRMKKCTEISGVEKTEHPQCRDKDAR